MLGEVPEIIKWKKSEMPRMDVQNSPGMLLCIYMGQRGGSSTYIRLLACL